MTEKQESKISQTKLIAVGIDVAKDTLAVCKRFHLNDGTVKDEIIEISNTDTDIKELAQNLSKNNYDGKVIIESTGRHHMLSAVTFSEANLDVRIINPLISKKYNTAAIRKIKSDNRDSQILAEIAIKENKLPRTFELTKEMLILRKKIRLIASLEKQLQQLRAITIEHKKTVETLGMELSDGEKQVIDTIDNLKIQKDQLEREVEFEVKNDDNDNQDAQNLTSIPGVSSYVASLVAILFSKDYDQSAKQWIAYAGMDVSVNQSGNWRGRCKLTKRGNPYLRKRLFSAAWGATMHNDEFKKYYNFLKNNKGRKHVEALTIIARKLLRIMFNLVQNNTVFDASKLKFEMSMN